MKIVYSSGFVYPGKKDVYFQARQRRRRDRVNQQEKNPILHELHLFPYILNVPN